MNDEQRRELVDRTESNIKWLLQTVAVHGLKAVDDPANRLLVRQEASEIVERVVLAERMNAKIAAGRDATDAEPDAETVERVATAIRASWQDVAAAWQEHRGHNPLWDELDGMDALQMAEAAIAVVPSCVDANLQRDISTWARRTFGSTTNQVMRKLWSEHDELGREVKYAEDAMSCYAMDKNPPGPSDFTKLIAPEAADVLFMLFQLAENFGFDLLEETRKKFEVNKQRSWVKQADGTYQHKEASNG